MSKDDKKTDNASEMSAFEKAILRVMEEGQKNQLSPETLAGILERVGVRSAEVMHKAVRPENEIHPHISAFSYPEGDVARPKPVLTRDVYLNFHKEDPDQLTPAEIEAYNSINDDCDARNGLYTAEIKMRGKKREELHIQVPVAHFDHRMNLPGSLQLLIHELKTGRSTEDLNELLAEVVKLRAELASARGEQATKRESTATARVLAGGGKTAAELEHALEATPHAALTGAR